MRSYKYVKNILSQNNERVVSLLSLLAAPFKIASQYVQDAQSLLHNLQQLLLACLYLKPVLRKTVFLLFSSSEHTQDQAQRRAASAWCLSFAFNVGYFAIVIYLTLVITTISVTIILWRHLNVTNPNEWRFNLPFNTQSLSGWDLSPWIHIAGHLKLKMITQYTSSYKIHQNKTKYQEHQ